MAHRLVRVRIWQELVLRCRIKVLVFRLGARILLTTLAAKLCRASSFVALLNLLIITISLRLACRTAIKTLRRGAHLGIN